MKNKPNPAAVTLGELRWKKKSKKEIMKHIHMMNKSRSMKKLIHTTPLALDK